MDKDDAIRLISDTCMENFSVIYVNEDFNVEDDFYCRFIRFLLYLL